MTGNRWWHALFAATMAVLVAIALVNLRAGVIAEVQALVAVGVLVVAYVTLGRRGFSSPRSGVVFVAVLVVCSGVAVAADPSMAIIQCIAMPLLWIMLDRTRDAILGNAVLAVVIGVALVVGIPSASQAAISFGDLAEVVLIEGISFAGSLALGLWITRIAELSAERARLLDELRLAQAEVEALGREAGTTSERARWAREVHDTIAQSLTGLVMLGQRAQRELAASSGGSRGTTSASALADTLALLEETAREALVETRSLVAATAPVDLSGGIPAALARLARRFERETGITVRLIVDPESPAAGSAAERDVEVVLLRCAQEGLANVRKHSGASSADLVLRRVGPELVLTVHDDGCGFDATAASDGFGLTGMRERLALVHGRLDVQSDPERGSTLTAALSLGGVTA